MDEWEVLARPDNYVRQAWATRSPQALLDFMSGYRIVTGTALRLHAWWETVVIPFRRGL
jgi:hypothetical protein